jgi:hypothetical protein
MREGRLRLEGTDRVTRLVASTGLVMLIALLGSLLLGESWRRGDLILLSDRGGFVFMPQSFFPVALVALSLAWLLLLWGAMSGSPMVQLAGALAFLTLNSAIGRTLSLELERTIAPTLVAVGYFAAPAVMALAALVQWRRKELFDLLKPYFMAAAAVGVAALFGGQLLDYSNQLGKGLDLTFPTLLDGAITGITGVLQPLVLVAGIAVVEFGYDVAEAAAVPAWRLGRTQARIGLLVLLAAALWFQFLGHAGEWLEAFSDRPSQLVGPAVAVMAFYWVLRIGQAHRRDEAAAEEAKESLVYGTSFALAAPALLALAGVLVGEFVLTQLKAVSLGLAIVERVPQDWLVSWGDVLLWTGLLLYGLRLARQYRENLERSELGLGLMLVALWVLPFEILSNFGISIPMSPALMGVMVTFGIAGYALANLRALDTKNAVQLGAVTLFLWLLTTEGDFLAIVGAKLGLPESFVVVFGIVFALLAGSSFATSSSKHFPRSARTLLWVGYMVLTTTLLNWYELAHGQDPTGRASSTSFFFLGIPIGVWMLMRRGFSPPRDQLPTSPR